MNLYLRGFTLIEFIVSIVVLSIILVFAVPSFKNLLMNNRVLAKRDEFASALNYARNTALSKNTNVIVCPMMDVNSTACGANWSNGWIVVTQPAAGTPVVLETIAAGTNDPTLSSVAFGGAPAASSVVFDVRGLATTQATFKVCDTRGGSFAQSVEVLPTGFVQSGITMGSAAWDGGALTCP